MKTLAGALTLTAAVLMAGSTLAQTAARGPAARPGATPPPAVSAIAPGTGAATVGQDQAPGNQTSGPNRDHIDQDAQADIRGGRAFQTNLGQTPVNGVGGTGGGRLSNVPPTNDPDDNVAAEAPVNTSRSNIKKPSVAVEGTGAAAPVVPPPIPPR